MHPDDIENLVSACANVVSCDKKVAGEPTFSHQPLPEAADPDLPHSFWLSKDAEFDWFDRNAFLDRRNSTKTNSSIPHPSSTSSTSNSQRFSSHNAKPKAPIIALPMSQKMAYEEAKSWKPNKLHHSGNLYPKRGPIRPVISSLNEPSSPKVSCIGRVRSRKERSRRLKKHQRSKRVADPERTTRKSGILESVRAVFRGKRREKFRLSKMDGREKDEEDNHVNSLRSGDIRDRLPVSEREVGSRRSWDGAGGGKDIMKRYSSGRRSAEHLGVAVFPVETEAQQ